MGKKRQSPTNGVAAAEPQPFKDAKAAKAAPAAAGPAPPAEVQALLAKHDFLSLNERGKVHCSITGMDVPARADALQAHLASKKLKKQREWYAADFSQYEPYITAHKRDSKLLFCHLTKKTLNRIPEEVETHVGGKRFKRLRAEREAQRARGGAQAAAAAQEGEGAVEDSEDPAFWMPEEGSSEGEGGGAQGMEEQEEDSEPEEELEVGSGDDVAQPLDESDVFIAAAGSKKRGASAGAGARPVKRAKPAPGAKGGKKVGRGEVKGDEEGEGEGGVAKPKRQARGVAKVSDAAWEAYKAKHKGALARRRAAEAAARAAAEGCDDA